MATNKEKDSRARGILYGFLAVLVIIALAGMGSSVYNTPFKYEHLNLEEGWNVNYRGRSYRNVALNSFDADGVIEGERVILEIELPEIDVFSPCLTFKTRMSRVRVYENDIVTYSYGYNVPEGYFIPKTYHYVPLSTDFAGKIVKIEIVAAGDGSFSGLYPVVLGNVEDLTRNYVQTRRLGTLIGVFMFYFGCILAVLSPFLILGTTKDRSVLFSAMISILLGVYIICYSEMMSYFTHNDTLSHVLEYVSLYAIPSLVILYITSSGAVRGREKGLYWLLAFDLFMLIMAIVLHVTRVLMINHLLIIFHVMIICESIYLMWLLIRRDREARSERRNFVGLSSSRVLLVGILLFFASFFLEMIRYYLMSFFNLLSENNGIDFITFGALAVVLSIMLNYFFHSVDHLTEARTRIRLHGMAFTDALTGIDNRASCDQFMTALAEQQESYALVSIDLDGLKIVNDKQGHSVGDMMISGFGALMRDAFANCDLVGRMGGDEFLIIRKHATRADVERDVNSLILGAEEENRRGGTFKYAFSYGTADSSEAEDIKSVYMLADERMYRMKDEHHQRKGSVALPRNNQTGGGAK